MTGKASKLSHAFQLSMAQKLKMLNDLENLFNGVNTEKLKNSKTDEDAKKRKHIRGYPFTLYILPS